MSTEIIPQEIKDTPAAIRATIDETLPAAREAAAMMRERQPRRVYFIGNGTSYYAPLAATYTARALAKPDDPLMLALPSGDFRHFGPALNEHDIVVGMTSSGEFRDVLAVFERLEGKCLRIGVTHVPSSSVTKVSDVILLSRGGPSHVPVMTKTYSSTMTAAHLLVLEFFAAAESYYEGLAAAADICEEALEEAERRVPDMVPEVSKFEHAFYFGAGCGYAAALEGALKMKEMAFLHAEGSETWEMASGPATMVSDKTLCVAFYTGAVGDESTAGGAQHAREWGARVIDVGPDNPAGDWHLPVKTPMIEAFASLALVPPVALLAYHSARARGATPDRPVWRERYQSQGMTHLIGE
jgi:glucosamine--fructose-6-phosphate aminotransferase (isomerizing)